MGDGAAAEPQPLVGFAAMPAPEGGWATPGGGTAPAGQFVNTSAGLVWLPTDGAAEPWAAAQQGGRGHGRGPSAGRGRGRGPWAEREIPSHCRARGRGGSEKKSRGDWDGLGEEELRKELDRTKNQLRDALNKASRAEKREEVARRIAADAETEMRRVRQETELRLEEEQRDSRRQSEAAASARAELLAVRTQLEAQLSEARDVARVLHARLLNGAQPAAPQPQQYALPPQPQPQQSGWGVAPPAPMPSAPQGWGDAGWR